MNCKDIRQFIDGVKGCLDIIFNLIICNYSYYAVYVLVKISDTHFCLYVYGYLAALRRIEHTRRALPIVLLYIYYGQ
jgi:hypothetical protein